MAAGGKSRIGSAYLQILPSMDGMQREVQKSFDGAGAGIGNKLGKEIGDDLGQSMNRSLSGSIKNIGKNMAKVGAGMSIAFTAPLLGIGRAGAAELDQIETANNQTTASLKRMDDTLLKLPGIQSLAAKLQKLSGQDDQLIQMGQNAILTFGGLNTSTKEGAAVFEKSSKVMVDFAEATGVGADAAGKQIAKSMASASNGVLLLPRGMKLAKDETDKLKKLFESNAPIVEKQAALMDVLGKKVEGASNLTNTDKWNNMQDELAGVSAQLITALLPAFDKITKAVSKFAEWFTNLSPTTQKWIGIIGGIVAILGPVVIVVGAIVTAVGAIAGAFAAVTVAGLITAATVGAIILAVVAVVAAAIWVYKNWDLVKQKLGEVWAKVKELGATIVNAIGGAIKKAIAIVMKFSPHIIAIKAAISIVKKAWNFFTEGIKDAYEWVKKIIKKIKDIKMPDVGGKIKGALTFDVPGMASGGTIKARPGGTLIRAAEAGRDETIVDTGNVNKMISGIIRGNLQPAPALATAGRGDTYNIYQQPGESTDQLVRRIDEYKKFKDRR